MDESNYFFAGILDLNIIGDIIFVGDDTDLEVIDVNYVSETITVDRSISWSDGDVVSLSSYQGSAPDIGSFESDSSGPDIDILEISNVVLENSNPLDTNPAYGWVNITSEIIADAGINSIKLNIIYPDTSSDNISMDSISSNTWYINSSTIF